MAGQLLDRKLKHIRATGATIVATPQSGCLLQLINGAKQQKMPLRSSIPSPFWRKLTEKRLVQHNEG